MKSCNADLLRCADASTIQPLAATDMRRDIIEPGSKLAAGQQVYETGHSTMDALWEKLLEGSPSSVLRQILSGEGKLVSLSVSEGTHLSPFFRVHTKIMHIIYMLRYKLCFCRSIHALFHLDSMKLMRSLIWNSDRSMASRGPMPGKGQSPSHFRWHWAVRFK
jgi:hypothetical protein